MLGSKVGMSIKSQDAEFDELHRKFTGLEGEVLCVSTLDGWPEALTASAT